MKNEELSRRILILHVRKGYEDREVHMHNEMDKIGGDYEFILDGDMEDLTEEVLQKYFVPELAKVTPFNSCSMKHLTACKYIVEHNLPGALVLEDDMVLYNNFVKVFNECMDEIDRRGLESPLINFEDSALRFVPRSQRRKGQHLYAVSRGRFAGSQYYSYGVARQLLDYVESHKMDCSIDVLQGELIGKIGLKYYYCHPCIATQGTHNGMFASSISSISAKKQRYRALMWQLKLALKKMVYLFR